MRHEALLNRGGYSLLTVLKETRGFFMQNSVLLPLVLQSAVCYMAGF